MSDQPQSFHSWTVLESALQDYERQTGISLTEHSLVERLDNCDSFDSVIAILQRPAQSFAEFRERDGRIVKSFKGIVAILYHLPTSSSPSKTIDLPSQHVKAIFLAFAILFVVANDNDASYHALVDLLESIERSLSRLDIYTKISPTLAMAETIIKIMVELLSMLALLTKQIKTKQTTKFVKKRLEENEVEAVLQRLDRLTPDEARLTAAPTLEVTYGLVQNMRVVVDDGKASVDSIRPALEMIQQMVDDTNKMKRDKLQDDLRRWLYPPDPWGNYNLARESRHSGTAEWFIQGDTFLEWKQAPSSLLWIHGKPGSGKSVICSTIIEDIRGMQKSGLASIAFFYCDFRDDQKRDLRGLLSSVLVQLCHQSDSYCDVLSDFYLKHDKGARDPSNDALVQCLKDLLEIPRQAPVYLIVDALDEFPNISAIPSPREEVLQLMEELIATQLPNLRICVTSRPEADIMDVLGPLASRSISLHGEHGQMEDINNYIRAVVYTDSKMRRWRTQDKEMVIALLTKKADGMFRWVYCQIDFLRNCLSGRLRRALDELPATLDETYERTLQNINQGDWALAHRLFQVVAVASRPLSVEELAELFAFDFEAEQIPELREDWRPEDPLDAVLSTCSTLLSVVNVEGSSIIQFSHFSVKEFLMSTRLARAENTFLCRYHISLTSAHIVVARACLGVLLHLDENVTRDSLQNFPLAEYAAKHWVDHTQSREVLQHLEDGLKHLFDPSKPHFTIWVWIDDPEVPFWGRTEKPLPLNGTPLHYAARYGFYGLIGFLIAERSQDVNCQDLDRLTPLHRASSGGHVEVARFLLECGADMTAVDKDGLTPLHRASFAGHVDVVRILLACGANLTVLDKNKWTPLHAASQNGYLELTHVLLGHGADVSARAQDGWTPLHTASQGGHVEVALILLQHGAAVMAQDKDLWTALHGASQGGHVELTRILLEHGANPIAQNKDGRTPLHAASQGGHVEPMRVLLEHGANPTAKDEDLWTPLHWASRGGHVGVVLFLLEHGVDATAQDKDGWTPFHVASQGGHTEVARVLLDLGAIAEDENLQTPLHWASERGHVEFARFLLERGVDPTAEDEDGDGWTPLHRASNRGHVELTLFLLEYGADLKAADNDGWTPLHRVSDRGHVELTRRLLERGADLTAETNDGRTPLHQASDQGRVAVVRILLEHGADPTAHDEDGWTSLHRASDRGDAKVARVLLEHGADPTAHDKDGWTPLHRASQLGHAEVALVLLECDIDASAEDKDGWTPLHRASDQGHVEVARDLLEHGADATAQDKDGWTPLYRASFREHVEVARVLQRGVYPSAHNMNSSFFLIFLLSFLLSSVL